MTSVNTILESVGINYVDLASQVAEARRVPQSEEPSPAGVTIEALANAVEQLASRLNNIAENAEDGFEDYYIGGTCMEVFDMATGRDDKDPVETVRSHLGLFDEALLIASPVFGHPELRCVSHTVLDHGQGTFTLTSYLVDVHSGDVTPAPGGPMVTAALG